MEHNFKKKRKMLPQSKLMEKNSNKFLKTLFTKKKKRPHSDVDCTTVKPQYIYVCVCVFLLSRPVDGPSSPTGSRSTASGARVPRHSSPSESLQVLVILLVPSFYHGRLDVKRDFGHHDNIIIASSSIGTSMANGTFMVLIYGLTNYHDLSSTMTMPILGSTQRLEPNML